jgi:hypothetical protein
LLVPIAVLCWQVGRAVEGLVLPQRSTSYQFFRDLGLAPLHFVLEILTVAVALAALGYLWRARPGWFQTTLLALGYVAVQATAVTLLMRASGERARTAFLASRGARGELLDPGRVDALFDRGLLEWRLVISLTFFVIAAALVWWRRDYVGPEEPSWRDG